MQCITIQSYGDPMYCDACYIVRLVYGVEGGAWLNSDVLKSRGSSDQVSQPEVTCKLEGFIHGLHVP